MTYSVEILRSAQKQLAKIDPEDRNRIITAIRTLAYDPRSVEQHVSPIPTGCVTIAHRGSGGMKRIKRPVL